jgi:uncharacterized protein (DUF2236 family)
VPSLAAFGPLTGGVARHSLRLLRRTLDGADGPPPWLPLLERPGDAGWFGPDSAAWQVHGSLTTFVGGIRALLLQALHPLALAGVLDHSAFRDDPLGRLRRTAEFVTMTTYGTSDQAAAAVRAVRRVHGNVVGTAPDGRPYAANDERLLLWVHVALADSMLRAYRALGDRPVDGDAYVADMARVAREFGIAGPPDDEAALAATIEGFRPELRADRHTRDVTAFLLLPPLPLPLQPAYQVLAGTAVDLLPPWARKEVGIWRRPAPLRGANRAATSALLGGLRRAAGPVGPAERAARARLRAEPADV